MSSILDSIHLQQIRCFLAVVNKKSFLAAADSLNTTQSAVSKSIARLEEALEFPLFSKEVKGNRIFRDVLLTEEGQYLYRHWSAALQDIEEAYEHIHKEQDPIDRIIRIGVPNATKTTQFLWPQLDAFREHDGHVQFHLGRDYRDRLIPGLNARQYDIVFVPDVEFYTIDPFLMDYEYIAIGKPQIILNVQNPLAKKESLTIQDIRNELFFDLHDGNSDSVSRVYREFFRRNKISPPTEAFSSDSFNISNVIQQNPHGFFILDEFFDLDLSSQVCRRPLEGYYNGILCVWKKNRHKDAYIQSFLSFFPDFTEILDSMEPIVDIYGES